MLDAAREVVRWLPAGQTGTCVLNPDGSLCRAEADALPSLIREERLIFHGGRICGAFPTLC